MTEPRRDRALARYIIIKPALKFPSGSAERARAIDMITTEPQLIADKLRSVNQSTVRRWIADYERRGGFKGLARKERRDKGAARKIISKEWDAGVPFDEAAKRAIRERLDRYILSAWASPTEISWKKVQRLATKELIKLTRDAGHDAAPATMKHLCKVPRDLIEDQRAAGRALAIKEHDAKGHYNRSPIVRNSTEGMTFFSRVVADVTAIDIKARHPDGHDAKLRLNLWLDEATRHFWGDLIVPRRGQGVRQAHIIYSLLRLIKHVGLMRALQFDNGSEFDLLPLLNPVLKLANIEAIYMTDTRDPVAEIIADRDSAIWRTRPNLPRGKIVESMIGILNPYFALITGYIGPDRTDKKTHNLGRAPDYYPGSLAQLGDDIQDAIEAYNTAPQGGALKGRSPRDAMNDAMAQGYRRIDVSPAELATIFDQTGIRQVRQGHVQWRGKFYYHDALARLIQGTYVEVAESPLGDGMSVTVLDGHDRVICEAIEDKRFRLDSSGARESKRRQALYDDMLAERAKGVDWLDMRAEMREAVALDAPERAAPTATVVHLPDRHKAIAQSRRAALPAPAADAPSLPRLDRRSAAINDFLARSKSS
jgi:hypothetical protein